MVAFDQTTVLFKNCWAEKIFSGGKILRNHGFAKASTLDARHYPRYYDRRAPLKPSFDENPDEISEQLHFTSQLESDGSATAHLYGENFPLIIITVIIL